MGEVYIRPMVPQTISMIEPRVFYSSLREMILLNNNNNLLTSIARVT